MSQFSYCVCTDDKVETFPVLKTDPKDIVDTNGAGDAFVGGKIFQCFSFDRFPSFVLSVLCFPCILVQVVPLCFRFPVWTGPGETTESVREGSPLCSQRHHQTSRLHLPRKTRLQVRILGQLFPHPATSYTIFYK